MSRTASAKTAPRRRNAKRQTRGVVEHDMRVVSGSDWVIDMGPEAGDHGGQVVAQGTPEQVTRSKKSMTAKYLGKFMEKPLRTDSSWAHSEL